MNPLKFNKCYEGLKVQDKDNNKGTITKVEDIHNIFVDFNPLSWKGKKRDGGRGIFCLNPDCSDYDPLFKREK